MHSTLNRFVYPELVSIVPGRVYEFGTHHLPDELMGPLWFDADKDEIQIWMYRKNSGIFYAPPTACYAKIALYTPRKQATFYGQFIRVYLPQQLTTPNILAVEKTAENNYIVDIESKQQRRENTMKCKVIRVAFFNGGGYETHRSYDYFYEGEANAGDLAVVRTDSTDGQYKVVKVVDVFARKTAKATKWALTVFNEDAVRQKILDTQRAAELRDALMQRLEEKALMQKLETAAEGDAEMLAMVEELKKLEGNQ